MKGNRHNFNLKLSLFSLLCFFSVSVSVFAQIVNDACPDATDFPSLTSGVESCIDGTTNGANGELPYINQGFCFGGIAMPVPAGDVWYSFTSVGNLLDIDIIAESDTILLALYEGQCDGLIGRQCVIGTGNTLSTTLAPVSTGVTYYLQISGGSISDVGVFQLCATSYDNPLVVCISDQTLTVDPPPFLGSYNPAQTVDFCLTVGAYNQNAADWFHGMIPLFGSAWDQSTFTYTLPSSCSGDGGDWDWYDSVSGTATTAIGAQGPGFFYDIDLDGDPGNNFGDNSSDGVCNWEFCFTITTAATCPPSFNGEDLSIQFINFSDSETGSWSAPDSPCPNDPNYLFKAVMSCCRAPDMTGISPTCLDPTSGSVTATATEGEAPFTFEWSNGVTETSPTASTIPDLGVGFYSVTMTDNDDCESEASYTLLNAELPWLTLAYFEGSTCIPGNGRMVITAENTIPPYSFSLDAGLTSQATGNFNDLAPGDYTVQVTDDAGCFNTIEVNIPDWGTLSANAINIIGVPCLGDPGGSFTVEAVNGIPPYNFSIDGGATSQTDGTFTNLDAGTYTVSVTGLNSCSISIEVEIPTSGAIDFSISQIDSIQCFGGNEASIQALMSGGEEPFSYSLDNINYESASLFESLAAGEYTIYGQDANNCQVFDIITINQPQEVSLNLISDQIIGGNDSVEIGPETFTGENLSYLWSPGTDLDCTTCPNPIASPSTTTTYTLTINNQNNCSAFDELTVIVRIPPSLTVPNAFSPNNDGVNDNFRAFLDNFLEFEINIFNRWGQLVFNSLSPEEGWDGTFKGESAEIGTYPYSIRYVNTDDETLFKNGNVTLIR